MNKIKYPRGFNSAGLCAGYRLLALLLASIFPFANVAHAYRLIQQMAEREHTQPDRLYLPVPDW